MTPLIELKTYKSYIENWEKILETMHNEDFKKFIKSRIKSLNKEITKIKEKYPEILI